MNETIKTQLHWQGFTFLMILEDRGKMKNWHVFSVFYSLSVYITVKHVYLLGEKIILKEEGGWFFMEIYTPDIGLWCPDFSNKNAGVWIFQNYPPPQKKIIFDDFGGKMPSKGNCFHPVWHFLPTNSYMTSAEKRIIKRGAGEKNYFSRNIHPCKSDLTYTSWWGSSWHRGKQEQTLNGTYSS